MYKQTIFLGQMNHRANDDRWACMKLREREREKPGGHLVTVLAYTVMRNKRGKAHAKTRERERQRGLLCLLKQTFPL